MAAEKVVNIHSIRADRSEGMLVGYEMRFADVVLVTIRP